MWSAFQIRRDVVLKGSAQPFPAARGSDKVLGLDPESTEASQWLVGIRVCNSARVAGKRIDEKKDVTSERPRN